MVPASLYFLKIKYRFVRGGGLDKIPIETNFLGIL